MFNILGLVGSFVLKWYAFKYIIKSHYALIVVASFIFAFIMMLPLNNYNTYNYNNFNIFSFIPDDTYNSPFDSLPAFSWPSHLHCSFITKIIIWLYPLYIAIIIALIGLSLGWFHWYGGF